MHCPHILVYSEETGSAHVAQDGPEYLWIWDQQALHIGE
jgi:hypothetical protein